MARILRPHQEMAIALLRQSLKTGHLRPVLQAPTGFGKCLGRGTPVLMFDGRVCPVEEIEVGDVLMGPDSAPRKVLSICRGREQLYRVVPRNGDPYVVNESHILSLKLCGGVGSKKGANPNPGKNGGNFPGKIINIGVCEYLSSSKTFKHIAKGWRAAVDFKPADDALRIDPYFLGLWLGDGFSRHPTICTGDKEIECAIDAYAKQRGLRIRIERNSENSNNYHVVGREPKKNPLLDDLRHYDLILNKHIPQEFKRASRDDRLQLIAGIIDTDGHRIANGGFSLALSSKSLMDDIVFVVRSLGFSAYPKAVKKKCHNNGSVGNYWVCSINGPVETIPCRVERKRSPARRIKKDVLLTGIDCIEPIGEGEYFGFEIDGDRLFMLGDFTVTHNTVVAGSIVNGALSKGKRVIVTVPAISLVDQTYTSLFNDGIYDVGVMQGNHPQANPNAPVQVASVQTLERRKILPRADLVLVDECHRWFKFYGEWMRLPEWEKVPFVGLSATPWTKGLGKHYDDLLIAETTQGLINNGYLSPFRVFASPTGTKPDLSAVDTVAGDYHEGQLSAEMQKPKLVADAVQTWLEKAEDRPTLCFGVDRAHAQTLQDKFERSGVTTGYIDSYTTTNDREMIRRRFHEGRIKVVCNVGCLTTGVDWDVRCISLCRPTKSEMLYTQIIGRGLRTAPGKTDCIILDHSDTTTRLGFVTDIHHSTLNDGKERKSKEAKKEEREAKEASLPKECLSCGRIVPVGVRKCPDCGFECRRPSKVSHADGELVELNGKEVKYDKETKQKWFSMFQYIAKEKGRKPGWVAHQYKEKFGVWPKGLSDECISPSIECRNFVKSRQIAFAKKREAEGVAA